MSACTMEFAAVDSGVELSQRLEPRSLLILKGEARFAWRHGIPGRKSDPAEGGNAPRGRRLSLTFRNVIRTV